MENTISKINMGVTYGSQMNMTVPDELLGEPEHLFTKRADVLHLVKSRGWKVRVYIFPVTQKLF